VSNFLFGAGLDPFWMAFRLVNSFRRYIGEGALTYAFIPVFQKALHEDSDPLVKKSAFRFASNIINIFILINAVVVILGVVLAPLYAPLLVPGYRNGILHQNIILTMIMMPYVIFISLYALIMGILNSYKKFTSSAFAPFFFNVVFMLFPIFLYRKFGIYSLGIAVVAGSLLMVVSQVLELGMIGFRYSFTLDFKDPYLKSFIKLFTPTAFNMIFFTVKNYATSIFLSFFLGSATIFMNTFMIVEAPLGIIGFAIGTVMMPLLSKFSIESDYESFNRSIFEGFNMVLYFIVPVTLFCGLYPDAVVNSVFRDITRFLKGSTGKFTTELLRGHYLALSLYSAALLPMAAAMIFERVFYSLHDARTPLKASIIVFFLSIGLYFSSFLPKIAFYGVFAADMTASWVTILYYIMRLRKTGKVNLKNMGLISRTFSFVAFSLISSLIIYPLHRFVYQTIHDAFLAMCIAVLEFVIYAFFYYILTRFFKMDLKR
jgi:putative peptidoglycan lipid II flippase